MNEEGAVLHQEPAPESAPPAQDTRKSLSLLASEMFRGDFYGTPEPPKQEPAPAPVEPETDEAEVDDEPAHDEPDEREEGTISSLAELIQHLEADPEWVDGLKVPVKVNGKPAETTMKDLIASYQMNAAAEDRLEDAKSKAKALTQELTQKSEAIQSHFAISAKLIERAESLLTSDIKAMDLSALRRDDPGEYAAKVADVDRRRREIDSLKNETLSSYQKTQEATSHLMQAEHQKFLLQEQGALLEALPEWANPEKAQAEKVRMVQYLTGQGFTEQDVMGASDHRLVLLAHKAMLYDAGMSSADAAKKKVAKIPRILKPGTTQPTHRDQQAREKDQKLRDRLRNTGRIEDASDLLRARRGLK